MHDSRPHTRDKLVHPAWKPDPDDTGFADSCTGEGADSALQTLRERERYWAKSIPNDEHPSAD